mmetsp:Transcript_21029/g.56608  ORF Transcript_21029/g.56608 Transcript_21029/m.56608 type:complete len:145 (+) Transcript_21029:59-493(+)
MSNNPQLKLPDCTALLTFEMALFTQRWSVRELEGLEQNPASAHLVEGIRECLPFLRRLQTGEAATPTEQANTKFGNMLCVGSKACPEEAARWYQCVQLAAARGGLPAANVECSPELKRLEKCGQRQASLLVSAALLRDDQLSGR